MDNPGFRWWTADVSAQLRIIQPPQDLMRSTQSNRRTDLERIQRYCVEYVCQHYGNYRIRSGVCRRRRRRRRLCG
jgi:hypothetical protein